MTALGLGPGAQDDVDEITIVLYYLTTVDGSGDVLATMLSKEEVNAFTSKLHTKVFALFVPDGVQLDNILISFSVKRRLLFISTCRRQRAVPRRHSQTKSMGPLFRAPPVSSLCRLSLIPPQESPQTNKISTFKAPRSR